MKKNHLYKYKGNKCQHCNKSISEVLERYGTIKRIFEFHHVNPKLKDPNYKNIINQKLSTKQLKELDKCVLLCAECHKILHSQDDIVELEFNMQIENRTVNKRIFGWIITDYKYNTKKFITDQADLLHPYIVSTNKHSKIYIAFEFYENPSILTDLIFNLADNDEFLIKSFSNSTTVLNVKRSGEIVDFYINSLFKVMTLETNDDFEGEKFWIQGGFLLDENNIVCSDFTIHLTGEINKLTLK